MAYNFLLYFILTGIYIYVFGINSVQKYQQGGVVINQKDKIDTKIAPPGREFNAKCKLKSIFVIVKKLPSFLLILK